MAIPCVLQQRLGISLALGGGCCRVPSSASTTSPSRRVCLRAWKKNQSTITSAREGASSSRKGSVAEKSVPAQSGGKAGAKVSKEKSGWTSSTPTEMDFSRVVKLPGPSPPAGFILDEEGAVVLVAPAANRVVTIVDPATERPLKCMIRRAFQSSDGQDCLLLLPLDMPIQILKIDEESEGLTELIDEELQEVLSSAVYALAKRRLHLIVSGFCLTARGGFCYTEEHVLDFNSEYGEGLGGSLTEGVEITNFQVKETEYIIYTPFDPVMFVARRDEATGQLKIADDDLLEDDVVLDAIDEENEFQALVDEEDAMHETLRKPN